MAEPQGPQRRGPASAGPLPLEEVAERAARLGITVERVLEEYARIAFTSLHDIVEWDKEGMKLKSDADTAALIEIVASATKGRPYRIKLHDKRPFLEAIERHLRGEDNQNGGDEQAYDDEAREYLIEELDRLAAEATAGSARPDEAAE
jgi:hypothetical protein